MSEPKKVTLSGYVRAYGEESNRIVKFRASTPALDRADSIVKPEGIDTQNFDRNPIFLWAHDGYDTFAGGPSMDSVIGKVINYDRTEEYFDVETEFAGPAINPNGEKALRMVRGGFLNAVSIGFMPKNAGYETIDGREIYVYRETELLEVSLVPIPANPEAIVVSNAFDAFLGLTPPPSRSGADVGAQLRQYAADLRAAGTVQAFARSLAKG